LLAEAGPDVLAFATFPADTLAPDLFQQPPKAPQPRGPPARRRSYSHQPIVMLLDEDGAGKTSSNQAARS